LVLFGTAAAGYLTYWVLHRGWTVDKVRKLVDETFDPKWGKEEAEIWISRWELRSVHSDIKRYPDGRMDGDFMDIQRELKKRPGIATVVFGRVLSQEGANVGLFQSGGIWIYFSFDDLDWLRMYSIYVESNHGWTLAFEKTFER